jgi:hypothetical protein
MTLAVTITYSKLNKMSILYSQFLFQFLFIYTVYIYGWRFYFYFIYYYIFIWEKKRCWEWGICAELIREGHIKNGRTKKSLKFASGAMQREKKYQYSWKTTIEMVHVYSCFIISIKFKSYNLFYDDSNILTIAWQCPVQSASNLKYNLDRFISVAKHRDILYYLCVDIVKYRITWLSLCTITKVLVCPLTIMTRDIFVFLVTLIGVYTVTYVHFRDKFI